MDENGSCGQLVLVITFKTILLVDENGSFGQFVLVLTFKTILLVDKKWLLWTSSLVFKKDGTFFCKFCDFRSKLRFSMKNHMENHIKGLVFKCDKCSLAFGLKSDLNMHKKSEHPDYTCECDEKFNSPYLFQRHRKEQHTTFKCDECEFK